MRCSVQHLTCLSNNFAQDLVGRDWRVHTYVRSKSWCRCLLRGCLCNYCMCQYWHRRDHHRRMFGMHATERPNGHRMLPRRNRISHHPKYIPRYRRSSVWQVLPIQSQGIQRFWRGKLERSQLCGTHACNPERAIMGRRCHVTCRWHAAYILSLIHI